MSETKGHVRNKRPKQRGNAAPAGAKPWTDTNLLRRKMSICADDTALPAVRQPSPPTKVASHPFSEAEAARFRAENLFVTGSGHGAAWILTDQALCVVRPNDWDLYPQRAASWLAFTERFGGAGPNVIGELLALLDRAGFVQHNQSNEEDHVSPTIDEIRNDFCETIADQVRWRLEKAAEYPNDKRNLNAVAALNALVSTVDQVPERLLQRFGACDLSSDDLCKAEEMESATLRQIGFGATYSSAAGLLEELVVYRESLAAERPAQL